MTKSQVRGKGFEYRMLYKLRTLFGHNKVKRIPSSGSSQEFKGDIWTDEYLIECKKTMHNSYRITKELMQKIKSEAEKHERTPLLMFSMNRTQPFVVMSYDTFTKLHKKVKQMTECYNCGVETDGDFCSNCGNCLKCQVG